MLEIGCGNRQAAHADPELAALWEEIAERRAANMRRFVADLAAVAPLRLDAGEAADIVWATNAAEMYQLLVGQRGWSPRRYEHFLADTWRRPAPGRPVTDRVRLRTARRLS